jgi:hypothetical protein
MKKKMKRKFNDLKIIKYFQKAISRFSMTTFFFCQYLVFENSLNFNVLTNFRLHAQERAWILIEKNPKFQDTQKFGNLSVIEKILMQRWHFPLEKIRTQWQLRQPLDKVSPSASSSFDKPADMNQTQTLFISRVCLPQKQYLMHFCQDHQGHYQLIWHQPNRFRDHFEHLIEWAEQWHEESALKLLEKSYAQY